MDQADHATWLPGPKPIGGSSAMQPQVSDIAFGVSIAPQTEQSTAADLIDYLRICLEIGRWSERSVIQVSSVDETLCAKRADTSAFEYVVESQSALAQRSAGLVLGQIEVFEA